MELAGAGDRFRVVPASGIELVVQFTGPPEAPRTTLLVGDARVIFEGELSPEAALFDHGRDQRGVASR